MIPGIGVTEIAVIALVVLLIFGPSAIVAWVAYTMGRNQGGQNPAGPPPEDQAIVAARDRYARGEINREEFEEIKSTLGY